MDRVLVTDASGVPGRAAVEIFSRQGLGVVAAVGDEAQAGVFEAEEQVDEVRVVDMTDPEDIFGALEGCDGMYLCPPLEQGMKKNGHNAILAAKQAALSHIVICSCMGASFDAHWRLGREYGFVDLQAEQSEIPFTVLRPNVFMQEFSLNLVEQIKTGVLALPHAGRKVSWVDARDVAACAVAAFADAQEYAGKSYVITGPDSLTGQDVAGILGKACGREIAYRDMPEEEYAEALKSAGEPDWNVEMLLSRARIISRDMAWNATGAVRHITGSDPVSLAGFADEHAGIWK